jgi:hypothetical protein
VPDSLAHQGALVASLDTRLARIEKRLSKLAEKKRNARRIRGVPPELLPLVASGALDPFFALLEARTRASGGRIYPTLRDVAAARAAKPQQPDA